MKFDTIIANAHLIDGTGAPGQICDIGIRNGRVIEVGRLSNCTADQHIDATGLIAAPGHVTQHSHYDAALFWDPYCSNSGEHGVTTLLNANCGFGYAPVHPRDRERTMAMMETTEQIPVPHQKSAVPWTWETFPEFVETLRDLRKGVNVMTYLPVNPLLVYVMGGADEAKARRPSPAEFAEMHRIINEAMDAGAIGISMSVMGVAGNTHVDSDGTAMPTDLLHHDDVVEIARALVDRGEGVIQMLSQIVSFGDRSISERVAEIAKGSGVRIIHNAIITSDHLPDLPAQDVAWIEGMRERGLDIVGAVLLNPGWVENGILDLDTAVGNLPAVREIIALKTLEKQRALLEDPAFVERFSEQYFNMGDASGVAGLDALLVIDVGGAVDLDTYMGRTLGSIADELGLNVVGALVDLSLRSDLRIQFKSSPWASTQIEQVRTLLSSVGITAGLSDGGAHTKAFNNGSYATQLLIWLARETRAYTLEELHRELSFNVARTLRIPDRGAILPGFWADILLYDLDELYFDSERYEIVADMPGGDWRRRPRSGGYRRILVNGVTTHENGKSTGATPGHLLSSARTRLPIAA